MRLFHLLLLAVAPASISIHPNSDVFSFSLLLSHHLSASSSPLSHRLSTAISPPPPRRLAALPSSSKLREQSQSTLIPWNFIGLRNFALFFLKQTLFCSLDLKIASKLSSKCITCSLAQTFLIKTPLPS
ncbi:hypothetical protein A2U01_0015907, partial [Trifolium medium]|nr:hypothetical protein [Trifolium medium]